MCIPKVLNVSIADVPELLCANGTRSLIPAKLLETVCALHMPFGTLLDVSLREEQVD